MALTRDTKLWCTAHSSRHIWQNIQTGIKGLLPKDAKADHEAFSECLRSHRRTIILSQLCPVVIELWQWILGRFFFVDINAKRKARYQEIANKQNTQLVNIERIAGEKLIEKAQGDGEFYMDGSGQWQR